MNTFNQEQGTNKSAKIFSKGGMMVKQKYDSVVVANRIKTLRKENGWTQSKLAELSGISLTSVKQYETKKRIPDNYCINALAAVFHVSPFYLLGETDFRNERERQQAKWKEYDSLHQEDLKRIRKELQFTKSAEALGFYHQGTEEPEKDYEEYIAYNRMYQERKEGMKTRSEIKVITGLKENRIIENFETGEITIQAISEEDVEKGFQQLIKRGIIAE